MTAEFLLEEVFIHADDGREITIRVTQPQKTTNNRLAAGVPRYVCYVQLIFLEDEDKAEILPVTSTSAFHAVLAAAEVLHDRTAPLEAKLVLGDQQGNSGFPRVLPELTSTTTLAQIDMLLANAQPKQIKTIP